MPTQLPPDEVLLEQAIVSSMRDVFLSVPLVVSMAKVEIRERFADNDEEDLLISTVPDPVTNRPITSIIQIGIPQVEEFEHTSDLDTQLNFTYPITFDLEVVDAWDNSDYALEFTNSRSLFMALYMRSRRAFKMKRDLGFNNCVHEYLQQYNVATVTDAESGGSLHSADWSLTVKVTGVLV